jgi:hypothetical protein
MHDIALPGVITAETCPRDFMKTTESIPAGVLARMQSQVGPHVGSLVLIACLPAMLAILNDYWPFTSTQSAFIDPWLYPSYFLHLKAQLLAFPAGYYGDRMSDTLPGWALYHLFGPWIGNFMFKLLAIYTAAFTVYFLLHHLFGKRVAVVCGLLIGGQPYFLMAFGWDYPDGIGITYCLLSLFFVFRAARAESYRLPLFLAGVFFNCLITSQFTWVNLAWIIPLGYFLANRNERDHPLPTSLLVFSSGFLSTFILFCAIHYGLNGDWFYLANTLQYTFHVFGATQEVNWPVSSWITRATWLAHYNGLFLPGVWLLLHRSASSRERICLLLFATSYVVVWAWQLARFPFAMLWYYSSLLFPAYILGLAAVLHRPLMALGQKEYRLILAVCFLGGIILYSLASFWQRLGTAAMPYGQYYVGFTASLICLLITVPICVSKIRGLWPMIVFVLGLLILYAGMLTFPAMKGWFAGEEPNNRQGFRIVLAADAWVNRLKNDRKLLWWSDAREPRQGIIYGITSLYLWGYTMLNEQFPELTSKDLQRLSDDSTVLVLSWKPIAMDEARAAFACHGLAIASENTTSVSKGSVSLQLGLFHIVQLRPHP